MPELNITASDPVTATVRDIAQAVTAVCTLLSTPEGQLTLKQWRESGEAFNQGAEKAGDFFVKLITGKLF